jgi:group I intron endonuclease
MSKYNSIMFQSKKIARIVSRKGGSVYYAAPRQHPTGFCFMQKICGIYKIKSNINNNFYIGSAIDFNKRSKEHINRLKNNKHENPRLQNHVNKYGITDLQFSILEVVMFKEDLIKREQFYINLLNPEFNICKIAGSHLGIKYSEDAKLKMRKPKSEEAKFNIAKSHIGIKQSKSTIEKRMLKIRGVKKPPITDEHKERLRKFNLGKCRSVNTKIKMSNSHKGKKHSIETLKKISLKAKLRGNNKGKWKL